jgi:N4-gp56 family major capsid protein
MPRTEIAWGDPKAQRRWSADLAVDTNKKSYFAKKMIGKGDNYAIEMKTEIETDTGDRVSFDLSVQLRGTPTTGDKRLKGKEENLRFYTDEVIVDQTRKSVSAGGKMTRKRIVHDLRKTAKNRLSDYWAKYTDELIFMYLSGARGINEDFIEPEDYTGHAGNPFQAPDNSHIIYGGDATSKASLVAADKMTKTTIERAATHASMMQAQNPDQANMMPLMIEGEEHYAMLMNPWQSYDLRNDVGAQSWFEINKAAAGAEGSKNRVFKGALGMVAGVVLHEHRNVIRFNDGGAGSNVPFARALFMGRQAGVIAYGVPDGANGRFTWEEENDDYGNEHNCAAGTIVGAKKTRFNGSDFGLISVDTAATAP